MKLGVCLESFGQPFRAALAQASRLGVAGVQCDAVGELAAHRLTDTGRREIGRLLRSANLELAALHCPLRRSLGDPVDLDPRLDRILQAMALSFDLGARLVVVGAGRLPEAAGDESATWIDAVGHLARSADKTGTTVALICTENSGAAIAAFLARFDSGGLTAAFDPARWLVNGFDPLAELPALTGRLGYVLAGDARRRGPARLVPLGRGDLDWLALAGSLSAYEYRGWITAGRPGVESPADLETGVGLLRRLVD